MHYYSPLNHKNKPSSKNSDINEFCDKYMSFLSIITFTLFTSVDEALNTKSNHS